MPFPIGFLARFAVPLTISVLLMRGKVPEIAEITAKNLEDSDRVLSLANGEGEGPVEAFDYIIVGGGTAGAVLANRLTASGLDSVLVLEAGGDPNPLSEVPMAMPSLAAASMLLDYTSVPSDSACVVKQGGTCYFGRGKALGGSSSVNGMVYNRCNAKDYESWADFTGDAIWSFHSVLDAFRAIENYHGFYEQGPDSTHGTTGEMHIGKMEFLPGVEVFFQALAENGTLEGDLNSFEYPSGFSRLDYNIKDGLRHSAYHAFLEPVLGRENLKIYRYALGTRVQLDPVTKQAVGVHYTRHGKKRYVAARKEILLAAGVIDSPKLLLLSGIGPAAELEKHGIESVLDLPVGKYLQEHLGCSTPPMTLNKTFGISNPYTPENIKEYITNGTGPMGQVPWWDKFVTHIAHGYFTSSQYNDPTWPDLHVYINSELVSREGASEEETIFAEVELVRTKQTGFLTLASADPADPPVIDPHFFEDPSDMERFVDGVQQMVDFFLNSPTYQSLGIRWSDVTPVPECKEHEFASKDYWACYIQYYSSTGLHPTSTCRMGPNKEVAVVDSRLRVFGAKGLRVIDSSVIPFVPNGNTHLPALMVGEMGARIVLGQV